jgi:hypothetical protein
MMREGRGIRIFPACGAIRAYRGSWAWDYGTGAALTRVVTLRDGRRIIVPGPGRIHAAHDIHGERGASIYAVEDAIIDHRNTDHEDPDGGWLIKYTAINPGPSGEIRTYFGSHLNEPAYYGSGEHVRAGDIIGVMGDSGNARGHGVHLHFQALEHAGRYGTVPVDVYEEMLEALEFQEGVTPSGELVAVETRLQGLAGLGDIGLASFAGAEVYREEGDFVSCHIPESTSHSGSKTIAGLLAVAGIVGGVGYIWWKER